MHSFRRLTIVAAASAVLAGVAATNAPAAEPFGGHVAMCAQELGQRADAPAVTCTHGDMTMTFDTFGAMVEHMRQMH
jgi:hypothetical protein